MKYKNRELRGIENAEEALVALMNLKEAVEGQRLEVKNIVEDVGVVLDAFETGVFVRNIKNDHDPSWAMKMLNPIAALARLSAARDAARGEE